MIKPDDHHREHQLTIFVALILFSLLLILIQMWLCFGVVENLIAGKPAMAIPAAVVSLVCFCVQLWMFIGIARIDRQV